MGAPHPSPRGRLDFVFYNIFDNYFFLIDGAGERREILENLQGGHGVKKYFFVRVLEKKKEHSFFQ